MPTVDQDPKYTLKGPANEKIEIPLSAATSSRLARTELGLSPLLKRAHDVDDDILSQSSDEYDRTFGFDTEDEDSPEAERIAASMENVILP